MPFNENVFSDFDFLTVTVTDRPMQQEINFDEPSTNDAAETCKIIPQCSSSNLSPVIITPEAVRPYPKVRARKIQIGVGVKGMSYLD